LFIQTNCKSSFRAWVFKKLSCIIKFIFSLAFLEGFTVQIFLCWSGLYILGFVFQSSVHNNLAIALCNEVLLDTDPYNMQVLLRALTQLELVLDDEIVLQNISTVVEKVAEVRIQLLVQDKCLMRSVLGICIYSSPSIAG
jgi:hypothetical protein